MSLVVRAGRDVMTGLAVAFQATWAAVKGVPVWLGLVAEPARDVAARKMDPVSARLFRRALLRGIDEDAELARQLARHGELRGAAAHLQASTEARRKALQAGYWP